jgi:DNA adenine methylase
MRNALRYFGGKGNLAATLIDLMPAHRIYVEPFGGGANVLIRKPLSEREVYNDLNEDVVNFFKWLRDDPRRLIRAIHLTPFSRVENIRSYKTDNDDPLEKARKFYIRSTQSFGGGGVNRQSGWRFGVVSNRAAITDWNKTSHLWEIARRLKNVQIECDDALKVSARCDTPDTVHSSVCSRYQAVRRELSRLCA